MIVSASKATSKTESNLNYVCRERGVSKLERSIRLPEDADVNKTEAKFENGVLCVSIVKTAPNEPLKRLQIA